MARLAVGFDAQFQDVTLAFCGDPEGQWLIALQLVRHPVGTEARLVALFQLLVMQFGIRRSDGYLLPFTIPHSRLAELIGATRSTVTRQINALRQQDELRLWEDGAVLFSDRLIEQKPLPRLY